MICNYRIVAMAVAVVLSHAVTSHANVITVIDDFSVGSVNLSSTNGFNARQTESGLSTAHVVGGVRAIDFTNTSQYGTTSMNLGSDRLYLNYTGSTSNYIYLMYHAGQTSFPSTGLNIDLTDFVALHIEFSQLAYTQSAQLHLTDHWGNAKVSTKVLHAGGGTTLTFTPADFTSGYPSNLHTIWVYFGGSKYTSSPITTGIEQILLVTVPEPASIALLGLGSVALLRRRTR